MFDIANKIKILAVTDSLGHDLLSPLSRLRSRAELAFRNAPMDAPERETLELAASGISNVIWCIGFRPNYQWLDVPVFNGRGYPAHTRGVTGFPGLYFIGLPWLYTWGSGRFSGIDQDARYVVEYLVSLAKSRHWKQSSGLYSLA